MASIVMCLAGMAAVSVAGLKLWRTRGLRDPGTVYLCGAVGFVGFSAVLAAPVTIIAAAGVEPFPNATRLLANALAMVAAFCVHGMLAHLAHGAQRAHRSIRRQALVLIVAVLAMAVLLVTAPIPADPDFVRAFADEPAVTAYVVVFTGYIAASEGNFIRLIRRYLAYSDRVWLRVGLTVVQVGALVGMGWAAVKAMAAVFTLAGHSWGIESTASVVLSSGCVLLVSLGIALSAWGATLAAPVRWLRCYRSYRALYPLWKLLADAVPEIVSAPVLVETESRTRDVPWKLSRRVVAIRDGLLFVAPYRVPDVAAAAREAADRAGVDGTRRDALVEAAGAVAAARARARGAAPAVTEPEAPTRQPRDFAAEVDWLVAVARACRAPLPVPGVEAEHTR